ncbi:collagen alpha-1(XII) chain-like [Thunnus thynnus]|uniref:collagen alpha-1(XII) chain-like n=1 Tax=Thunnus thynnus TaxID=8237 RepID=UPI0035294E81
MDHLLMVLVLLWSSGLQAEDKHQPTGKKREYISSGLGTPLIPQEELEDVTRTSIILVLLLYLVSCVLYPTILCFPPGSQCESTAKADIVLLVCESRIITSEDHENIKSFLTQIVNNFDIGPDKVQIGLVQYADSSVTQWDLNTHQTKQSLLEAIANLPQEGEDYDYYTGRALRRIQYDLFQPNKGTRSDSQKILILITDGESQDDVSLHSQHLRDDGIEIYTIGVKNVNEAQLRIIASDPDEIHMFSVIDSSFLLDIVANLNINLCNSVNSSEPVRLVGGASRCAGTLEVKRGEWRPVSYSDWTMKAAAVVCRDLDCGSAVSIGSRDEASYRSVWEISFYCVHSGPTLRDCASSDSSSSIMELTCSDPTDETHSRNVFIITLVVLPVTLLLVVAVVVFIRKASRGQRSGPQENTELDSYNLGVF